MTTNTDIADRLDEFADLLEARDVEYKPRAYRRAADNVREQSVAVEQLAADGEDAVAEVDRVGDAIASKIVEYVETGEIAELEELRAELPVEIDALTRVDGVGPKTVGTLYEELEIQSLDDLEAAAAAGEIREVAGFGPKTEANILDNIDFAREAHARQLLGRALPRGEEVREYLAAADAVERVELAGSIRRHKPTIGDVDVLVGSTDPGAVVEAFTDWRGEVLEAGTSKASLRVEGVRVDLRVVDPGEFGAALQYFTGSRDHNLAVRTRAIERDMKINEYGVFDVADVDDPEAGQRVGERVAGETERGVYEALGMARIPPELRENRGEVGAAGDDDLPDLVEPGEIRGDLHTHSQWSDGSNTVAEMVAGAEAVGHDYLAVTDHATGPGIVGGVGLTDEELRDQRETIRAATQEADIDVFAGVEANIGPEGEISVGEDLLAELDIVVASPHAALDGDGTERLVAAAKHPEVDIIGHPTGRRLNQRPGLTVDVERVAAVAADHDTALEVNANPHRLDLRGRAVQTALAAGAMVTVDTDAHAPAGYEVLRYGVRTARRGWAEADDILNTRDADEIRELCD
jgi:DNA polymerase (family 10)